MILLVAPALAAALLVACPGSSGGGGDDDAGGDAPTCPRDLPDACPSPPPSFKGEIAGIIARRCGACHTDGGVAQPTHDFSTYEKIAAQRSAMLNQVYGCRMPPADASAPDPAERAALLGWLVCRAPDN